MRIAREPRNAGDPDEYPERDNLYNVLQMLPLISGNLYLNMQAMNIGMTDWSLEDMEKNLLAEYIELERTPAISAITVSAWSQMWVFAFYELLRTWRQKTQELIAYGERLKAASASERAQLIQKKEEEEKRASSLTIDKGIFRKGPSKRIEEEPEFVELLKRAYDLVEPIFREVENVRVTLAKHEIPKSGRNALSADAPGYGRIDMSDGSIYWSIIHKDGSQSIISRRGLADSFLDLSLILEGLGGNDSESSHGEQSKV